MAYTTTKKATAVKEDINKSPIKRSDLMAGFTPAVRKKARAAKTSSAQNKIVASAQIAAQKARIAKEYTLAKKRAAQQNRIKDK